MGIPWVATFMVLWVIMIPVLWLLTVLVHPGFGIPLILDYLLGLWMMVRANR